jgi:hypothetical protein
MSSKTQQVTRVAIKVIVRDAHHVHVFISHVLTQHREGIIVIRIKTREVSVLRALAQACRVQLLSMAAIVLVTIIIMRVAISLVLVSSMVSSKATVPVHSMVSSKAIVLAIISRRVKVAISPVLSMVSRANTDSLVVAISPVSRVVMLPSAVATNNVVAISPVSRAVMVLSAVVTSSAVAISNVPTIIVSILLATIPMLNIA